MPKSKNPKTLLRRRANSPLTVLIAPSGFKESLSAEDAAEHIASGVLRALPQARVLKAPMADGGEGFTQALVHATDGTLHPCRVTGPVGGPVDAFFGFLGGREEPELFVQDMPNVGSMFSNDKLTYKIRHIYGGNVLVDGFKFTTKAVVP